LRHRLPSRTAADLHRAWLTLVDCDGPFLAVPPLKRVYPQGLPSITAEARDALRQAKPDFDKAWDEFDQTPDQPGAIEAYRAARDHWVDVVLRRLLGWGDHYSTAADRPGLAQTHWAQSADRRHQVAASGALTGPDSAGALVLVIDPVRSLRDVLADGWATSPIDRLEAMLRVDGSTCSIGLVTDGRWWAIVSAPAGGMAASGVVDSQTWIEEAATRDAFAELLSIRRLLGGKPEDRLPALFAESVLAAEEITEALGVQIRRAVELVVSAFSEAARDTRRRGEPDPLPADGDTIYQAVVTVMMRLVFLLFAEERGLLPQGQLFENGYGLALVLDDLESRARDEGEEAMDASHLTWHRLLATSQALYAGASFEDMRLPAYGGSLFDPTRFPFLTAVGERGALTITVSDRVMLHVLRAVQVAKLKGQDARRISFRDIDVEQIGYIYEGLLGHTCRQAEQIVIGLPGAEGAEPEIPLETLAALADQRTDHTELAEAVIAWVKENQPAAKPPTKAALAKALGSSDLMEDAERALLSVTPKTGVRDRLRPWIGAIRRDLRGRPTVVLKGDLFVAETPSRRNAGAHYTPRSLAEEIVQHALEPLVFKPGPHQTGDRSQWRRISSDAILDLRVADIACGSGAFLVAAARFLARELVEAWQAEGVSSHFNPHELEIHAIREVVAQCLYGADINEMAVEMCKLSLWLVSLDHNLPFSFVDDKVLLGNSLLGVTDLKQIEALHVDPAARPAQEGLFLIGADQRPAERVDLTGVIKKVRQRRQRLSTEVSEKDPGRTADAKRRLLDQNENDLVQVKKLADGVIAAGLPLGGKPGRKLDQAYENLEIAASLAYPPRGGEPDPALLDSIIDQGLTPTVVTDYHRWRCLHWALAVPDVMERGGFDAIVGNPPFLGGQKLTGAMGADVRDWFVNVLADGRRGSADLVAYFFLRATSLLQGNGTLGLIATNTLAQGDTREVGLDAMVADGFTITRAIQSRSWPAASANLEYAAVWGTLAPVTEAAPRVADDATARRISTLLEPAGRVEGNPIRLAENQGIAFQGCIVLGMGFVITPDEAQEWIDADPRNAEVLFPYLNGEDLNSRPDSSASRWVIDFGEMTADAAVSYKLPWSRVSSTVKPERIVKDAAKYPRMVNEWWKFWNARPMLRKAISKSPEVLVIALVSKTVMPLRVPTGQVFSHMLGIFASSSYSDQAVLSSSLHQLWAITYGSTLETRVRYTPSDVFETFPRPSMTTGLDTIGATLDGERREMMLRRNLGLTKLYNLINDPDVLDSADADVARLRSIHRELDVAAMASYGWGDVRLDHGFHIYRGAQRWTFSGPASLEVLDRLLEENHRRASEEHGS
jgi:methylase of polypeptide subunit release factors